ncbi:MAG: hypothetical protein HXY25_12270 [Alphaproteobacteria bacterium]|nr:hypothetical protein [Alphaproteobacteria bacterium]
MRSGAGGAGASRRPANLWAAAGLALLLAACGEAPPETAFVPAAPQPMARIASAPAVVGERIYFLGGFADPRLRETLEIYSYDPKADEWRTHPDMPVGTNHVMPAVVEDRYIWIAGGFRGSHPGTATDAVFRYDTVTERWEEQVPLPAPRASGALVHVNGRLHFFGGAGLERHVSYPEHWTLDPRAPAAWVPAAPMPEPRAHFAAAVANGKIYVLGGIHHHDGLDGVTLNRDDLDLAHRYDPQSDSWEEIPRLPAPRSHMEGSTFAYGGRIWTLGGRNNEPGLFVEIWEEVAGLDDRGLDVFLSYRIADGTWRELQTLPRELYATGAGVVGDTLVISGGGLDAWRGPSDLTWTLDLSALAEALERR